MLPDVFQLLNVASIRAFVGTSPPRIYRHGVAPQGVAAPYITWAMVSGTPQNHLDGTPPVDALSIQVDCWSENTGAGSVEVNRLAEAVRNQIETAHHITSFDADTQDVETLRYRQTMTFSYWNPRI